MTNNLEGRLTYVSKLHRIPDIKDIISLSFIPLDIFHRGNLHALIPVSLCLSYLIRGTPNWNIWLSNAQLKGALAEGLIKKPSQGPPGPDKTSGAAFLRRNFAQVFLHSLVRKYWHGNHGPNGDPNETFPAELGYKPATKTGTFQRDQYEIGHRGVLKVPENRNTAPHGTMYPEGCSWWWGANASRIKTKAFSIFRL